VRGADRHGWLLPARDLVAWLGLKGCLTREELSYIEAELERLIEAERTVECPRQSYEARSGVS
jgi:hypothetical protein